MSYLWNIDRLNKDLARIDGAIMAGRYNLAMKLAHRSLKQYYRSVLKTGPELKTDDFNMEQMNADNIRQMAIYISKYLLKYFRKYNIPYSERRVIFISLVSNFIFIATMNLSESDEYLTDKAAATYARENVYNIISYLMRYFG